MLNRIVFRASLRLLTSSMHFRRVPLSRESAVVLTVQSSAETTPIDQAVHMTTATTQTDASRRRCGCIAFRFCTFAHKQVPESASSAFS